MIVGNIPYLMGRYFFLAYIIHIFCYSAKRKPSFSFTGYLSVAEGIVSLQSPIFDLSKRKNKHFFNIKSLFFTFFSGSCPNYS